MAEIVAGFLGPAIEVVKWIGAPIMRQFNYLCCFTTNVTNLEKEAKKLDDAEEGIQAKVDRALDDVQIIVPQVKTWLEESEKIKGQKTEILAQVPNVGSGCFKLRPRFSLSKRAKKTADRIRELRGECNFDVISVAGPPTAREAVPLGKTYEFESRKQIEDDTMAALKSGDVSMIGICGMGGLGKTTMAKRIMNRVLKEGVFEEVVMAVVSQQVDKSKIRCEIAGSLGLKLESETSEAAIVKKLHARLSGTKRILLVLDDVWETLELEDLGIPCDPKCCTILLTSRNRDVLCAMNVQEIEMDVLYEEEAWFLFREEVGTCVDDSKLNSRAKEVVKECKGLTIALKVVGAALKDEKNVGIWEDALRQLKQCNPDIPNLIAKVYNPLKLSYDFLESKHAKSLFLLCCLFHEDANICLEMLTSFCMGLGIFEGIENLEQARNRIRALIKMLKSRSLLLDAWNEDYVRMHDVVRDICTFIAKQEKYIDGEDCTWISTCQRPTGLGFPNARLLLLISSYNSAMEELKLDDAFLGRIRDLYVLCVQGYGSLTSMPRATQPLTNLNTLFLDSCEELNSISVVGELVNLEILICRSCPSVEELPRETKGLHRLKVLELTRCHKLQRIGRGIISSLVGLEELKMRDSFKKWEAEDSEERENAGLRELEALTNLRWLEIDIQNPALAAEKMHLSSKIDRFIIRLGAGLNFFNFKYNKRLHLLLAGEICLGHWIEKQLLRDTEYLYLCGNGANKVSFNKMMKLEIIENENPFFGHKIFISLFHGLKELRVSEYRGCMGLFTSSITRNLANLEVLYISSCDEMVQVVEDEEEEEEEKEKVVSGGQRAPLFPNLQELFLYFLSELVSFCEWKRDVELPSLRKVYISKCPNMENFTMGFISTPNLEYVSIDYNEIDDTKDLNGALQEAYMARPKKKQEEEDESGKEIQEIKEREQK